MSVLSVKDVKKSFGKTEVLKGVTFDLDEGEVLSIIGSSGSGKTTLLRCLNFLETPDTGIMTIAGDCIFDAESHKNLKDSEIRERRLRFGLVFQSFNLFPQYNVLDNITLAPTMQLKDKKQSKTAYLLSLPAFGGADAPSRFEGERQRSVDYLAASLG